MVAFSLLYVCPLTNQAQPKAQVAINSMKTCDHSDTTDPVDQIISSLSLSIRIRYLILLWISSCKEKARHESECYEKARSKQKVRHPYSYL